MKSLPSSSSDGRIMNAIGFFLVSILVDEIVVAIVRNLKLFVKKGFLV